MALCELPLLHPEERLPRVRGTHRTTGWAARRQDGASCPGDRKGEGVVQRRWASTRMPRSRAGL